MIKTVIISAWKNNATGRMAQVICWNGNNRDLTVCESEVMLYGINEDWLNQNYTKVTDPDEIRELEEREKIIEQIGYMPQEELPDGEEVWFIYEDEVLKGIITDGKVVRKGSIINIEKEKLFYSFEDAIRESLGWDYE